MAPNIPATERIKKARALIQKAHDYPIPPEGGRSDFSYIANVKNILQQAIDMVKFIRYTPTATPEMKAEVESIYQEVEQAKLDILKKKDVS